MNKLISIVIALALLASVTTPALADGGDEIEIPKTITVRRTYDTSCGDGSFTIVEMDFKEYVKGALAAEWGNRWHINSLKAGAVAVKMYAMRAIQQNPKWKAMPWAQDRVADVYDCVWDIAYKPEWINDKIERAVEETWDYFLVDEDEELFYTFFNAWDYGCWIRGETGNCMGQWQSFYHAIAGKDWKNILMYYYHGSVLVTNDGYYQDKEMAKYDHEWIDGESNAHVVKFGETLTSISKLYYGTPNKAWDIYTYNQDAIIHPNFIRAGQIIFLPDLNEEE